MKKLKINDIVYINSGKDKGKTGKVLSVKSDKILVESINKMKKHIKPSKINPQGGIVDKELAIDISNVVVVCPSCNRPTRVGFKKTGENVSRICKRCKEVITYETARQSK
ncbi:50S ribosomal protein L24 [Candidatus Berkelbacteria bacterium CG10_big_fil_rev_8_21_14_0_10_41_12]|uniref:Large ribosomal subunit protein uL24 n=1 Tax=Candidatus Berkelbacteria bacterium CG10_big_fil_rev_8_21_14_0_10_41_12 TaxID=1974513 RepID=A0A2M6WXU3_9BACT|nr:MAG: 50S ribosomal protein L24 [Candidatus Berkelbacteria bacterium CG10_big_fil_rev_8_21_14_0_10_41_12]